MEVWKLSISVNCSVKGYNRTIFIKRLFWRWHIHTYPGFSCKLYCENAPQISFIQKYYLESKMMWSEFMIFLEKKKEKKFKLYILTFSSKEKWHITYFLGWQCQRKWSLEILQWLAVARHCYILFVQKTIMLHLVPLMSLREMTHNSPCRKCAQCLIMNRNIFLYTQWSVSYAATKIYVGIWETATRW